MKIATSKRDASLPVGFICQPIEASHLESVGLLMDSAYRGTIDHEGETLAQCVQEIRDTIQGKYGPFIAEASFVVFFDEAPAAAILITEWKGQPLVAYTMTAKEFQGRGLAKFLISKAVSSLGQIKWKELFLVVTEGNVAAEKLYEKMGFQKAGLALPGTPPPSE
jgi:GNAT superfamily N-acetyltransferase